MQKQLDQCPSIGQKRLLLNLARNIHSPKDFWSAYHKLPPNHPKTPPQITLKYHSAEKPLRRRIFLTIFLHLVSLNPHSRCYPITNYSSSLPSIHTLLYFRGRTTTTTLQTKDCFWTRWNLYSIMLRNTASYIATQTVYTLQPIPQSRKSPLSLECNPNPQSW